MPKVSINYGGYYICESCGIKGTPSYWSDYTRRRLCKRCFRNITKIKNAMNLSRFD